MEDELLKFIREHGLFSSDNKLLVAVSGGVDSVLTAHLLINQGFNVTLAHCNFNLRGDDSRLDEEFVTQLASRWDVPFHSKHFFPRQFAAEQGVSLQMASRTLRYQWLNEILDKEGYDYLVTAHHATDQIESVLLNQLRGTGMRGYYGMKPKSGHIVRPLLFATKEQIIESAKEAGLDWREDESNLSSYYERNLLRNQVLPELRKISPQLEKVFSRNAERARQSFNIYYKEIQQAYKNCVKENNQGLVIDLNRLLEYKEWQMYLYEWLRDFGFQFNQLSEVKKLLEAQPGKKVNFNHYDLFKDRDSLILLPSDEQNKPMPVSVDKSLTQAQHGDHIFCFEVLEGCELPDSIGKGEFFLDYDKITFPLTIRFFQSGDYFYPLGLGKKKKIKEELINQKVPRPEKGAIRVVESRGEVVAIPGIKEDDRFKVDDSTKRLLHCTFSRRQ